MVVKYFYFSLTSWNCRHELIRNTVMVSGNVRKVSSLRISRSTSAAGKRGNKKSIILKGSEILIPVYCTSCIDGSTCFKSKSNIKVAVPSIREDKTVRTHQKTVLAMSLILFQPGMLRLFGCYRTQLFEFRISNRFL